MLRALNERLVANMQAGKDTVLIVDEAHCIRDPDVFEELRMLLNFQLNDRFLLTLILMAQPEIKDIIKRIKQLDQRIAIRHHLKPLDQTETIHYIGFRLQRAGAKSLLFTEEALQRIWHYRGKDRGCLDGNPDLEQSWIDYIAPARSILSCPRQTVAELAKASAGGGRR